MSSQPAFLRIYLLITAGLCGAMVMVVQVLGSRVIGPFFGVSLFVWTSLITVTLVALAAGYGIGGRLADKTNSASTLYALIIAAGVCVMVIPFVQMPILKASVGLGLRAGALLSSAILFGPALVLLGCVSPFLVRLLAGDITRLGRTVGGLYALSTGGSFAGTIITGFFLIGVVGISRIFMLAGLLLVLLGAGYFFTLRRRWGAAAALPLLLLLLPAETLPAKTLDNGTRAQVIEKRDSFYGNLRVVDYSFGPRRTRELSIDGLIQGGVDMGSGQSVYEYPYLLQFLPRALYPEGRNCLVIGLGAGVVPRWYAAQGIQTEAVDIDHDVIDLARTHFGFPATIPVHVQDARHYLATHTTAYDYVVLDVFSGDTTPGHLLSIEALHIISQRLIQNGVLAINMVGSLEQENFITASVVKTLLKVFDQVEVHPVFSPDDPLQAGNLVIMAYRGKPRTVASDAYASEPIHPMAKDLVQQALARRFQFPPQTPAVILTDDFNPIDLRDLWIKERVRKSILETTDPAILLG